MAGGGLTVIANAPKPAGAALLRRGLNDGSIGALGLLLGALVPTVVAIAFLLLVLFAIEFNRTAPARLTCINRAMPIASNLVQ